MSSALPVRRGGWGALLLLLVALGGIGATRSKFQAWEKGGTLRGGVEVERFFPDARLLRIVFPAFRLELSNLYWLAAVQYLGDHASRISFGYHYIEPYVDLVTNLDPSFDYAYVAGSIFLTLYDRNVEAGNRLLEKGWRNVSGDWQIPFFLGFNHMFYEGDLVQAGLQLKRAMWLPHHPPYLGSLVAALDIQNGSPEEAEAYLEEILAPMPQGFWRNYFEMVLHQVQGELLLIRIERAARAFHRARGRFPRGIDELVSKKYWAGAVVDPFGGRVTLDSSTGKADSTSHFHRLRLYDRMGREVTEDRWRP